MIKKILLFPLLLLRKVTGSILIVILLLVAAFAFFGEFDYGTFQEYEIKPNKPPSPEI